MVKKLVESLFLALHSDQYPEQAIETVFGIKMGQSSGGPLEGRPIGSLMYCAWQRLFVMGYIEPPEVEAAILRHGLPAFFEKKCRELLTVAAQDKEFYPFGSPYGYVQEIARRGFGAIEWDRLLLQRMAGDYGPVRGPAAAAGASVPAGASAADPSGLLGRRVELHGLKGDPTLNGAVGDCVSFDRAKGRYGVVVRVPGPSAQPGQEGRGVAARPENLKVAE